MLTKTTFSALRCRLTSSSTSTTAQPSLKVKFTQSNNKYNIQNVPKIHFHSSHHGHLQTRKSYALAQKLVDSYNNSKRNYHNNSNYQTMKTHPRLISILSAFGLFTGATYLNHSTNSQSSQNRDLVCFAESSRNRHPSPTPTNVDADMDFEDKAKTIDDLPEYTSDDVAQNDGSDGKPIWMSYGGVVYDVTNFIHNHPGGSERILLAAGSAIEPYWHLYRQHYSTDLPMRLMEDMIVGRLSEKDQNEIDLQMEKISEENEDPYAHEPLRHKSLIVHSDQPMNAEVPDNLITDSYITPADKFYIRHHHPVPLLSQKDIENYELEIDLSEFFVRNSSSFKISLADIKKLPKVEVTATLQCSGNRRGDMNSHKRTSGTSWGQGAISTATWGGARLVDVLRLAGLEDPYTLAEMNGTEKHVRFESLDGMKASIGLEKATSPYGDVIVAYEMNHEPLTRDHGFPLRIIVPGYCAVRNVKWLKKIEVSGSEAEGAWQRGLNYKTLPPNVEDANKVELAKMPSMTEASVFSGITNIEIDKSKAKPGSITMVKAKGWAWAGGGRNIVRVDLTGDGGKSWTSAHITHGGDQKFSRAWAWVFWECENVPAIVQKDGSLELASKATDLAFNSQPEDVSHSWNVRGLGNNSWYRTKMVLTGKTSSWSWK